MVAQGDEFSEARHIIRRRRIVLAYRHGIALLDRGNMGMPVPAIGTRSNLFDEPHGVLPGHSRLHTLLPLTLATHRAADETMFSALPSDPRAITHQLSRAPGDDLA